uniref:Uncharacterized protein n=1 Tax=Ciona intestinalis TaxID=7719 RepID=H2Y0A8_CIOIN
MTIFLSSMALKVGYSFCKCHYYKYKWGITIYYLIKTFGLSTVYCQDFILCCICIRNLKFKIFKRL